MLSVSALQSALLAALSTPFAPTLAAAADRLASAYGTYAATAQAGGGTVVITAASSQPLAAALTTGLNPLSGTPAQAARAWADGVQAFWLTPPVAVAGGQAGTVTAFLGYTAFVSALTAVFADRTNTSASAAQRVAQALHTATLTVTATVAPPPGAIVTLV